MKKGVLFYFLFMVTIIFFQSCGGPAQDQSATSSADSLQLIDEKVMTEQDKKVLEDELRSFLISTEGTYGWETKTDKISLDFFEDGRLHIQGPDGEATMWEGNWKLKGDRLSMVRPDLKSTETESVSRDGDKLMIGAVEYTRYKAE
jgi:hypothetical protein